MLERTVEFHLKWGVDAANKAVELGTQANLAGSLALARVFSNIARELLREVPDMECRYVADKAYCLRSLDAHTMGQAKYSTLYLREGKK